MSDPETIAVYDARAQDYADTFTSLKEDRHLTAFIDRLPSGGRVLDLGCGPGQAAARLADAGFIVDAWDASGAMVDLAGRHPGVTTRQARFGDLTAQNTYDGIWANFSLLHAPRADFPDHVDAIAQALHHGGIFHIGMKTGANSDRDGLGRSYTYYTMTELEACLTRAGFFVLAQSSGSDAGLAGTVDPWAILLAELSDA